MTTLQIALVAAAGAALLALVVIRLATRRKAGGGENDDDTSPRGGSFLDDAPQDTLEGLGKVDPAAPVSPAGKPGLAVVKGQARDVRSPAHQIVGFDDDEAAPGWAAAGESDSGYGGASTAEPVGATLVPLSSIMVTTSTKMVDLEDPEVRRMLADLVDLEIEQAVELRREGLTVDAAMQLTEAEKIAEALRLEEPTRRIREMIAELRGLQ